MPKIIFVETSGDSKEVEVPENHTVLQAAHIGGIDMEGACEGSMACSTCHVIVEGRWIDKLPPASASEEDLLDLTYGVTGTSRLGCQISIKNDLDGLIVKLPPSTRNMMD
jgi:2Fe-2S ferredoxin